MTVTASSRLRGGTRAVQTDRRQRLRRVTAGVAIGFGCATMAAAAIGAGMYAGAARTAFASARSDAAAPAAETIIAKTFASPVAARFPSIEASLAMRDDANANPTFAFAIPEHAQRAGACQQERPAPPSLHRHRVCPERRGGRGNAWRKVSDQFRPYLPKPAGFLAEAETEVLA